MFPLSPWSTPERYLRGYSRSHAFMSTSLVHKNPRWSSWSTSNISSQTFRSFLYTSRLLISFFLLTIRRQSLAIDDRLYSTIYFLLTLSYSVYEKLRHCEKIAHDITSFSLVAAAPCIEITRSRWSPQGQYQRTSCSRAHRLPSNERRIEQRRAIPGTSPPGR